MEEKISKEELSWANGYEAGLSMMAVSILAPVLKEFGKGIREEALNVRLYLELRAYTLSWCDDLGIEVPESLALRDILDKYIRPYYGND